MKLHFNHPYKIAAAMDKITGPMFPGAPDRTKTVFDAEIWSLSNVYIFPEKNRDVHGVMWVIPPCDNPNVAYGDGSGFSAQNFAYDQIKAQMMKDKIKQDDWIVVIGPRHELSLEQISSNAKDTFRKEFFNYIEHIDLCGCCKDPQDREFINVLYAMGDGANAVEWNDPTITNIVLIDPILYGPVLPNIPPHILPYITMVSNPANHDPLTESGNATILAQNEIGPFLGINLNIPSLEGLDIFNHMGLLAAGIAAFAFNALSKLESTMTGEKDTTVLGAEADIVKDIDEEIEEKGGVVADPASGPDEKRESSGAEPAGCGDFAGPQIIITSDRILFDAKRESILMSSNTHIGLSAKENVGIDAEGYFTVHSPEINLGLNATEPIILGDKLGDWLEGLINSIQLLTYTNAGGPTGPAINNAILNPFKQAIPTLKSPQNKTL